MRMRNFLVLVVVSVLAACGGAKDPAAERAQRAASATGDIVIGLAGPMTGDLAQFGESLSNGSEMALAEINGAGGVLGRKLKIEKGDDQAKPSEGTSVAQRFAGNIDMVAVVGHFNSGVSIPTSAIYDKFGIVQISPASTNPKLTDQGFRRVFRNLPNDNENGRQLADFAGRQGYKKMAIYFANNAYGKGLADVFEARAKELGIVISDRQAYDADRDEDFRPVLTRWKPDGVEAICIAGETPKAAIIIAQARELGLMVPFMGGDGLASSELWKIGGAAAEGTFVTSYFHAGDQRPEVKSFNDAYQAKHNKLPDVWAAQAYDAVKVLAEAIRNAKSTEPDKITDALRALKDWPGVTGLHTFDPKGDVVGKSVIVTCVKDAKDPALARFDIFTSPMPVGDSPVAGMIK